MTENNPTEVDPIRRRKWFLAGLVCGALVIGCVSLVATRYIKSPAQAAAEAEPPPLSQITVPVERRVLRQTLVLRGTVVPKRTIDVAPTESHDGGRLVLTRLGVKMREAVKPGQVVAEVSGRPIIVLAGGNPAFRDLRPSAEGRDVAQLQAALRALGHSTAPDRDGFFGAGTKSSLTALYKGLGYSAATTGDDDGQQISAARLQLRRTQRALASAIHASTGPGASIDQSSAANAIADAKDAFDEARQTLTNLERQTGAMLPMDEVAFIPSFPARVVKLNGTVGSPVNGTILTLSTGELVVKANVQPSDRSLVRPGQDVEIASEATGLSARGKVASLGQLGDNQSPASPEDGGILDGEGPTEDPLGSGFPVTVRGDSPFDPGLAGQDVRITIVAASTSGPVLVVPLAAITTRADGKTQVVVIAPDGGERLQVVRVGTSGDGYAEIVPSSDGLSAGTPVLVGR